MRRTDGVGRPLAGHERVLVYGRTVSVSELVVSRPVAEFIDCRLTLPACSVHHWSVVPLVNNVVHSPYCNTDCRVRCVMDDQKRVVTLPAHSRTGEGYCAELCVSVCLRGYIRIQASHVFQTSPNFRCCMFPVVRARSCFGDVAIRWILSGVDDVMFSYNGSNGKIIHDIGWVLFYTTAGVKTRRVLRARGAGPAGVTSRLHSRKGRLL